MRSPGSASIASFESQADCGHPLHASIGPEVVEERGGGRRVVCERDAGLAQRQERRLTVGEEEDVGLDPVVRFLAEGQDAQRDPGIGRRDRDVDRRTVPDLLVAVRGAGRVEGRREEDRTALRVEVEDLWGIGRQPEAMVLGPLADLVRAALAGP